MILICEFDFSPGGAPEMPYAVNYPHGEKLDVLGGLRTKDKTEYLVIQHHETDAPTVYARRDGSVWFGWAYNPSRALRGGWVSEGLALAPGQTRKLRGRWVTRMTDDELQAHEPIKITKDSADL